MKQIDIYTDGACRGNPGPGGWAAILQYKENEKVLYGSEPHTTNNRMELMAVIKALEVLTESCQITITTDSKYVSQGITEWIHAWRKKGWRNASNKPVKNADLWQQLDAQVQRHTISWEWVKGHSGHEGNEKADAYANQAIDELQGVK